MITIAARVRRARCTLGSRKIGTALLTASTPVSAVQPLANVLRRSQRLAAVTDGGRCGGATTGAGGPWAAIDFQTPTPRGTRSVATNREVGTRETSPDSRTPRRLTR